MTQRCQICHDELNWGDYRFELSLPDCPDDAALPKWLMDVPETDHICDRCAKIMVGHIEVMITHLRPAS